MDTWTSRWTVPELISRGQGWLLSQGHTAAKAFFRRLMWIIVIERYVIESRFIDLKDPFEEVIKTNKEKRPPINPSVKETAWRPTNQSGMKPMVDELGGYLLNSDRLILKWKTNKNA